MIFCSIVIIENDQKTTNQLRFYLKEYCPEIVVSAVSDSVSGGVKCILKEKPDIVFLDIDVENGQGFSVLDQTQSIDFEVIITTENRDQAKKAFDYNASHYILKPFSPLELRKAIGKAMRNKIVSEHMAKIATGQPFRNSKSLTSSYNNQLSTINICDVMYIESRVNGSMITLQSGKKIKSSSYLKNYEENLENSYFYRINRSYLINMDYVKAINQAGNYSQIEMVDGSTIYLPQTRKTEFTKLFHRFIHEL